MANQSTSREQLLNRIVEIELHMFERVRASEPSLCQERPEAFKAMRMMTHSPLSQDTLTSYLNDLHVALGEGKNLMTVKYARMEGKLLSLKENPLIGRIVEIEDRWMKDLAERYPRVVRGGPEFAEYLTCELETYSDETLELLYRDVTQANQARRNLAEERYDTLFKSLGYASIDEAEAKASEGRRDDHD